MTTHSSAPFADADALIEFLARAASVPSEEGMPMTELDHALQTAHELAARFPDDIELQIAGLVHDVGHSMGTGDAHGRLGGDAVRPVLGERVAALVEGHVPAKRYLVTVDPEYRGALSPGSIFSLELQGGLLDDAGVARCAALPWWSEALELRRADDAAKVPGAKVADLDRWIAPLRAVAVQHAHPS
jgi:predicted HD phosphohydrolase